MTFSIIHEVTNKTELCLWALTTQGKREKLPSWAHVYLNSLADSNRGKLGFGDKKTAYATEDVNMWICVGGWTIPIVEDLMDAEAGLLEAGDKVHASADRYTRAVLKLRSEVKNDIASISSSTSKSVAEIAKLDAAITKLQADMNSASMMQAIANAERLAAALTAISAVQSNNITFAVLGNKSSS